MEDINRRTINNVPRREHEISILPILSQIYHRLSLIVEQSLQICYDTRATAEDVLLKTIWKIVNICRSLILPFLKVLIFLWFLFLAAIGIYYMIYKFYLPSFLLEEPVYFDFSQNLPQAKLNLLIPSDHSHQIISQSHYGQKLSRKFLRGGSLYSFSLKFYVAKSSRNQDIGKFMANISIYDKVDTLVATSLRPIIVPFHSKAVRLADSLFKFPYYFLGYDETEEIEMEMLKNYREPTSDNTASASHVTISLNRADVDISKCSLTIYPELSLFVSVFFY